MPPNYDVPNVTWMVLPIMERPQVVQRVETLAPVKHRLEPLEIVFLLTSAFSLYIARQYGFVVVVAFICYDVYPYHDRIL